jgi:hypothetical protein
MPYPYERPPSAIAGVPIFYTDPQRYPKALTQDAHWGYSAMEATKNMAELLGGDIRDPTTDESLLQEGYVLNPLLDWRQRVVAAEEHLRRERPAAAIPSTPIGTFGWERLRSEVADGKSYFFGNQHVHGGNEKYVLDEPWQVNRAYDFLRGQNLDQAYVVREIFDARDHSGRFACYRLLVTAAGVVIGATLGVSWHTDSQRICLEGDLSTEALDPAVARRRTALEDPRSNWYLDSRDVRSHHPSLKNMAIPLWGRGRLRLTDEAREILRNNDIDPQNPLVPADILELGQWIGQSVARTLDLVVGVDVLKNLRLRQIRWNEVNTCPEAGAYDACHTGYQGPLVAQIGMRFSGLRTIAHPELYAA